MSARGKYLMTINVWYKGDGVSNGKVLIGRNKFAVREAVEPDKLVAEILSTIFQDCYNTGYYLKNIELITKEEYEKLKKNG